MEPIPQTPEWGIHILTSVLRCSSLFVLGYSSKAPISIRSGKRWWSRNESLNIHRRLGIGNISFPFSHSQRNTEMWRMLLYLCVPLLLSCVCVCVCICADDFLTPSAGSLRFASVRKLSTESSSMLQFGFWIIYPFRTGGQRGGGKSVCVCVWDGCSKGNIYYATGNERKTVEPCHWNAFLLFWKGQRMLQCCSEQISSPIPISPRPMKTYIST